jgi:hypothetical protein
MPRVVGDAGALLDDLRDAGQGPQIRAEPVGASAGQQRLLDLGQLRLADARGPARGAAAAQRVLAAVVPAAIPAADVLAADAELAGDLGLGHLTGKQRSRSEAELLLGVTVAARAPTRPATARLGRHRRILAYQHEHVVLYREPL